MSDDLAAAAAILRAHGWTANPPPSPEQVTDNLAAEMCLKAQLLGSHINRGGPLTYRAGALLASVEAYIADMREAVASRTEREAA